MTLLKDKPQDITDTGRIPLHDHAMTHPPTQPAFFAAIPSVVLHDALAELLGASPDGRIEYTYAGAVALAGHSCPTVAGAWLMTTRALAQLYPDSLPERGQLTVDFRDAQDAGTTGVVAAVVSWITGATGAGGFKGLAGAHARCGLMHFGVPMQGQFRITRRDTLAGVELDYHPERVPPLPEMAERMGAIKSGTASAEQRRAFGDAWQDRVRRILTEHSNDPELVTIKPYG